MSLIGDALKEANREKTTRTTLPDEAPRANRHSESTPVFAITFTNPGHRRYRARHRRVGSVGAMLALHVHLPISLPRFLKRVPPAPVLRTVPPEVLPPKPASQITTPPVVSVTAPPKSAPIAAAPHTAVAAPAKVAVKTVDSATKPTAPKTVVAAPTAAPGIVQQGDPRTPRRTGRAGLSCHADPRRSACC